MKENNNNNNEKKYDINRDYILSVLILELVYVLICCFMYCVVEKNWEYGHYSSIISLIVLTILNLYSGIPRIIKQLKEKKDDNNVE